ncbi:MAG: DsbA family protein [Ferruginibacter sp.]
MSKPILIYCYDAYCGWCYGFSPVIKKIAEEYKDKLETEVLSGGMMVGEEVMPIEKIGPFIQKSYKRVEELTGIKFGEDFLWHINNPDKSDWVMNSEKPAIALCIFKEYHPERQLEFATDLQYALNYEGRDLDDDEAYQHLLEKYSIQPEAFYRKLKSDEYKEAAYYEFALMKQLQVNGYPSVFIQTGELKFVMVARGYTDLNTLTSRIDNILAELNLQEKTN